METKRLNEKQSGSVYGQNMCIKTYIYCVCASKRDFTIFNKGLTQPVKGETFFWTSHQTCYDMHKIYIRI